jgi:hypothetical protein
LKNCPLGMCGITTQGTPTPVFFINCYIVEKQSVVMSSFIKSRYKYVYKYYLLSILIKINFFSRYILFKSYSLFC